MVEECYPLLTKYLVTKEEVEEDRHKFKPDHDSVFLCYGTIEGRVTACLWRKTTKFLEMISMEGDQALTLPEDHLLSNDAEETFFRIFHHRTWYFRLLDDGTCDARWAP